jgi:hypothetical protein
MPHNWEGLMKKLVMIASLAMTCAALPAFAASEADCQAMWKKADANNDGVLSEQESLQYSAMMRVHDKTLPPDGKLTQAAFMEACKGDVYTPRKNDAGAPLKGANSFTEGQAKDRAMAAGFTTVSSMKKDDDGIWRGTATRDGKSVPVAVDYKGNVVATSPNAN